MPAATPRAKRPAFDPTDAVSLAAEMGDWKSLAQLDYKKQIEARVAAGDCRPFPVDNGDCRLFSGETHLTSKTRPAAGKKGTVPLAPNRRKKRANSTGNADLPIGPPSSAPQEQEKDLLAPDEADRFRLPAIDNGPRTPGYPLWMPEGDDLRRLPVEIRQAIAEIVKPAYDELVTAAASGVERAMGASVAYLLWLEVLDQFDVKTDHCAMNIRLGLEGSRSSAIDQYMKLLNAKLRIGNFMIRLRELRLKESRHGDGRLFTGATDSTIQTDCAAGKKGTVPLAPLERQETETPRLPAEPLPIDIALAAYFARTGDCRLFPGATDSTIQTDCAAGEKQRTVPLAPQTLNVENAKTVDQLPTTPAPKTQDLSPKTAANVENPKSVDQLPDVETANARPEAADSSPKTQSCKTQNPLNNSKPASTPSAHTSSLNRSFSPSPARSSLPSAPAPDAASAPTTASPSAKAAASAPSTSAPPRSSPTASQTSSPNSNAPPTSAAHSAASAPASAPNSAAKQPSSATSSPPTVFT